MGALSCSVARRGRRIPAWAGTENCEETDRSVSSGGFYGIPSLDCQAVQVLRFRAQYYGTCAHGRGWYYWGWSDFARQSHQVSERLWHS